jgi:hypothetical protein
MNSIKALDRMEWRWLNYVVECFDFGQKFRTICYLKGRKILYKTISFMSKFFAISSSTKPGCPVAPILYIIQAEPMACANRNTPAIHGTKLPD